MKENPKFGDFQQAHDFHVVSSPLAVPSSHLMAASCISHFRRVWKHPLRENLRYACIENGAAKRTGISQVTIPASSFCAHALTHA
jgi:hypothetical protein